jgi:hypothetical protein
MSSSRELRSPSAEAARLPAVQEKSGIGVADLDHFGFFGRWTGLENCRSWFNWSDNWCHGWSNCRQALLSGGWLIADEVELVVEGDGHAILNLASVDPGDFAAYHTSPNAKRTIHAENFELARRSWSEPQTAFDENTLSRRVHDPDLLRLDLDRRDFGNLVEGSTA